MCRITLTIVAFCCLALTYTHAAITSYTPRPNSQYSGFQQNEAYFTSNQNQYTHNNHIGSGISQQQQPQQQQQQHPLQAAVTEKNVLDRFHHRFPDGSYEFRYELADGTARYERGYFLIYDKIKTLVVVGYYSYRQTDGRYITVFYNADQNGYRQNQSITPQVYPNLPRSIEVPQFKDSVDYATERPNKGSA